MGQGQSARQELPRGEIQGYPFERFLVYRYLNFIGMKGALEPTSGSLTGWNF